MHPIYNVITQTDRFGKPSGLTRITLSGKVALAEETFTRWIEQIYTTEEHEIDCKQLQNFLPAFVDAEVNRERLPHTAVIRTHLQHCPDCQEIYEGLNLVIRAEAELPSLTMD